MSKVCLSIWSDSQKAVSLWFLRIVADLASIQRERFQDVQITAWGSFALEVPSLNFRSFSLVSSEKVYSRDSEDYNIQP